MISAKRYTLEASWCSVLVVALVALLLVGTPASVALAQDGGAAAAKATGPVDDARDDKAEDEKEEAEEASKGTAKAPQMEREPFLPNTNVSGQVMVGIRAVDVGGREAKFREDIDLDDGARLLNTRLVFTPMQRTGNRLYDRATIEATGIGGDPFESFGVTVMKREGYRFSVHNRTVDYFWNVTGEPHAWDLTRTNTDASLTVDAIDNLKLSARFGRWRQDRFRTTTRDLSRDEFFFNEPLDQDSVYFGGGARYTIEQTGTTLFYDQEFRSFNDNSGFDSGPTDGLEPGEAELDFLDQKEVRAIDAPIGRFGISQRAVDGRVQINADYLYSNQSLGFDFTRVWDGLTFQERPVEVLETAQGQAERLVRHGNLGVSVLVHPKVSVTGKYRHREFNQTGDETSVFADRFLDDFSSDIETDFGFSDYEITHDQFLFGAEVRPDPRVTIFGEVGATEREQFFDWAAEGASATHEEETSTTAFRFGGAVRPDPRVRVNVLFERGDIDDGFTRITPTQRDRFNVRARVMPVEFLTIAGHVVYKDVTNDQTEYNFESTGFGGSVTYARPHRAMVTASFSRLDTDTNVPIRFITPFFGNFVDGEASYTSDDNLFNVWADVMPVEGVAFSVFGGINYLDSSGTVPLEFYDLRFGGRYVFPVGFFFEVEGRFIDYEENTDLPSAIDDYDATMATVAIGYRFH